MAYDITEIKKVLPHRYPFLLIDRIEEIDGMKVKARKCVTANEEFFQGHFPEQPIMPGVLQLEAMAQAGAFLILSMEQYRGKIAVFGGANNVKWKKMVVPGDVLDIEIEITKLRGYFGCGVGCIKVDGEIACQAEVTFFIK